MQDKNGNPLQEGDRVLLECVITHTGQFAPQETSLVVQPADTATVYDPGFEPHIAIDSRLVTKAGS